MAVTESVYTSIIAIERKYGCRIGCHLGCGDLAMLPGLVSIHASKACNEVKKNLWRHAHCTTFELEESLRFARKSQQTFLKICPFGLAEVVSPVFSGGIFRGVIHAGTFQTSGFQSEHEIRSHRVQGRNVPSGYLPKLLSLTEAAFKDISALLELLAFSIGHCIGGNTAVSERPVSGNRELIEYHINSNFRIAFGLNDLAAKMRWTPEHTSREVRRLFGRSFVELLNESRMKNACMLLENSTFKVNNVAWVSGFHDSAYFSRLFMKKMKMTPGSYRRKGKEQSSRCADFLPREANH